MVEVSAEAVATLRQRLLDQSLPMPKRYRALFSLRNCRGDAAREALVAALSDPSALLAHDCAFALGQMQDPGAMAPLQRTLEDRSVHAMVRHEAAEALGAIGQPECLPILRTFAEDSSKEVAETCQLALKRIEWREKCKNGGKKNCQSGGQQSPGPQDHDHEEQESESAAAGVERSPFLSVDPTPPAPDSLSTEELVSLLLDSSKDMFDRYRAMFRLRNRATPEAICGIASALEKDSSALLKHEVAYVLGQIQSDLAVQPLMAALADKGQHPMVRHEAAEALGAIASKDCVQLLESFSSDPEPVVAHSCEVALDVLHFESQEGAFQYADVAVQG
ncbi:hypothetical protein CBR_g46193 [Chara braunii]|uniref:Deoxyhypusine hydroxylase n=1 Tax=Chara braunii TaxID=69332 RepID=A0A388M087_CHABU|nr:hypothetical protein CBR_g46193 [Chara braunii]|eukprot:GBG87893.1 hypothetical protein CBR_g46193 [Chara braunii]